MFGRGQAQTRQDLARAEFGESLDHFRLAATHAAGGLGASVGPRMGTAKGRMGSARGYIGYVGPGMERMRGAASQGWDTTIAIITPLADAARQGSIRAAKLPDSAKKKISGNGGANGNGNGGSHVGSTVASIVAAGAAIGATGALVARRRTRSKWAEYEPSELQDEAQALVDETRTANRQGDNRPRAASKMAGWAKERGRSTVGNVRGKMHDSHGQGMSDEMSGDAMRDVGITDSDLTGGRPGDSPDAMSDAKGRAGDPTRHMADKADAKLNDAATRRGSKDSNRSAEMNRNDMTTGDANTGNDSTRSSKDRHR